MKKFLSIFMSLVLLFSVSIMLTGCKDKKETISLYEVTHSIFYAPLYVAINNGYFEDEGINLELTNAGGSDAVMTALVSGNADIGLMGPESVLYVLNGGMQNAPKIFAQLTNCDGSFIVGRENNPDFSYEDLVGSHIIAGRKGGMPAMTLQYILNEIYGLTTGDNTIDYDVYLDTSIAFNLTASSFVSGIGDYCSMFDPTASQCVEDGTGYILSALGEEISNLPYTVFTANANFIKNNSKKLDGFLRALKKGYEYLISASDTEIISSLKPSFSTTSDSLILASVKNYIRIGAYASNMTLKEESWNLMQDVMDNAGELEKRVNYSTACDMTYVSKLYA